jgi:glycosyltransferase involved in cell wall biosynthesis
VREGRAPLVSVIIPVFNGERFLAQAIESVLAQDHRQVEIIVIDDGSTDGSREVAEAFEDVIVIASSNSGAGAARNLGLTRAKGAFVTFLDADDLMAPGRLSAQLEHLRVHPETGCVLMRQELLIEPDAVQSLPEAHRQVEVNPMTAFIRRSMLETAGGFDPSYWIIHDTVWLFRLRDAGVRIDILPEVGLIRRIHGRNLTNRVDIIRSELARSLQDRIRRGRLGDRSST